MLRRSPDVPAGPPDVAAEFGSLRRIVQDAEKYIALSFPEYTPHDRARHLDTLFGLADRLLGVRVYSQLVPTELILLAFGLYAHDWGMAVAEAERQSLFHNGPTQGFVLLPDEPTAALHFVSEAGLMGIPDDHIRIKLRSTETNLILEWSDNGIGMDEHILSSYFATVGRSWYKSAEARRLSGIEAVSQFGIGILSCFTVSRRLTITTRKDSIADISELGLVVEIPARDRNFRIQPARDLPIGTTLTLKLLPQVTAAISKQAVCIALARICRYVHHSVTVDSDGVITSLGESEQ